MWRVIAVFSYSSKMCLVLGTYNNEAEAVQEADEQSSVHAGSSMRFFSCGDKEWRSYWKHAVETAP